MWVGMQFSELTLRTMGSDSFGALLPFWKMIHSSEERLTAHTGPECPVSYLYKKITGWVLIAVDFYGSVRLRGEGLP